MQNNKYRFFILKIVMLVMLVAIAIRLFDMQILEGSKYLESASNRITTNVTTKAARGDVLDKYGNVLVTNKTGYSVTLQKSVSDNVEFNKIISDTAEILNGSGSELIDSFPISQTIPYTFIFEDKNNDGSTDDEKQAWFDDAINKKKVSSDMTPEQVMISYAGAYGYTGDINSLIARDVIGIRYEGELKGFSAVTPITIAEDITVDAATRIKEKQNELEGVMVAEQYVRTYNNPGLATQMLGRVGRISAEEYEKKSADGYGMNDIIGKQGIEKWAESYLRGKDGRSGTTAVVDGKEVEVSATVDPVPGDYLMLTVDSDLQKTVEDSLKNNIRSIGKDCNAGAAVVLDVNSGDTLAIGSYPSYDMTKFNDNYSKLVADKSNPMINRAVSGLYSPGSTFKPLTAIAGIQTGNLKLNEQIEDTGIYTYYADYQPTCWIWSESKLTHGKQDVTMAIENSCNVFFYELGRRLGIEKLDEYAKKFGLGEYTGIELTEEAEGHMASPEYKKEIVLNVIDGEWFGGDTLQAAIGQSYSLFTPVQLADYCATIANGGTRYKVNLIDSIRSSVDGSLVEGFDPKVVEKIDIAPETLRKIHDGMKKVVDEGSASSVFDNYPIQIGGKTGTAQLGSGSNNAIFIAFAPFDNPQIAVAVVLEHGVRGTNAGRVAKDIFDKYFFGNGNAQKTTIQNTQNQQNGANVNGIR